MQALDSHLLTRWLPVVGYEGLYEVSNSGFVRTTAGRLKKPHKIKHGYLRVTLVRDGVAKHYFVHKLVLQAWVNNPEGKQQGNHVDGDKLHNNVENLEWATASENIKHSFATGLNSGPPKRAVIGINVTTGEGLFLRSLTKAKLYGFLHGNIRQVLAGKFKQTRGWAWYDYEEPK